jgi:hypothetical protein
MDIFQFRGGRMLMQRIGGLNPVRQRDGAPLFKEVCPTLRRKNRRSPESYGLWAFPYPLFDAYFASFQFQLAQPKRLRELERAMQGSARAELSQEEREKIWAAYEEEHEKWAAAPATKERMRVRKFWVSGTLYTHLGAVGDTEWQEIAVPEFGRLLRRQYARDLAHVNGAGMDESYAPRLAKQDLPPGYDHRAHRGLWPTSTDHLEVFLGRGTHIH